MSNIIINQAANGWIITTNIRKPVAKVKDPKAKELPERPAPPVPSNVHIFSDWKAVLAFLAKLDV